MKEHIALVLLLLGLVYGNPGFSPDCAYVQSPHSGLNAGTGGFGISGLPATYTPGATYTLTITGGNFKGFLVYAKAPNSPVGNVNDPRVGTFATGGGTRTPTVTCSGSTVCQSSSTTKANYQLQWTAPAAGSGPVGIFALVVVSKATAYQLSAIATATEAAATPTSRPFTSAPTSAPPGVASSALPTRPPTSAPVVYTSNFPTSNFPTYGTPTDQATDIVAGTSNPNGNLQGGTNAASSGKAGGLSTPAIIGISVGAGLLLLCVIANFIPIMAAKQRGQDPRKAQTLVGAAVRATRTMMGGNRQQGGNGVRMYR